MRTALVRIEAVGPSLPGALEGPPGVIDDETFEEMDGCLGDLRDRLSVLAEAVEAYRSEFDRLEREVAELAGSLGFASREERGGSPDG
jgi:hypothetical protein